MKGRILIFILFASLFVRAQIEENEWTEEALEARDTLTLNNCPPRLLWSVFGLSQEQIYSLYNYRSSMGAVLDPLELYYLNHWDSATVRLALNQLPLQSSAGPALSQTRSRHRLSYTGKLRSTNTVTFQRPLATGALHHRLTYDEGTFDQGWSGYLGTNIQGKWDTELYFGDHQGRVGQGLLWNSPSFPNPTSGEVFGSGIRGKSGSGISSGPRGLGLQVRGGPWSAMASLDTGGFAGSALRYGSYWGELGVLQESNNHWSVSGKWIQGSFRWFGEMGPNTYCAGANYWTGDLLIEYRQLKKLQWDEARHYLYLSWRDSHGTWNLRYNNGLIKGRWIGGQFDYSINAHSGESEVETTWRHRLRWTPGPWQLDVHLHGQSKGLSFRWQEEFASGSWTAQWSFLDFEDLPYWAAVPVVAGTIGSKAVYRDFAGLHLVHRKGAFQWSTAVNIEAEQPSEVLELYLSYTRSWS